MTAKLVSLLIALYPTGWRKEYGTELADMLRGRPLTARVCSDVVMSALWQHVRADQAATVIGLGLMAVTLGAIASNILAPPPAVSEQTALLQKPLSSEFYVLVLCGLGFWTAVRGRRSPGRSAMRASFIASLPVMLIGLSMLSGVLEYTQLAPGQPVTTFGDRGMLYTFYKGIQQIPGPGSLALLLAPLLRLPGAWLWGTLGGSLGRKYADWRRPISA